VYLEYCIKIWQKKRRGMEGADKEGRIDSRKDNREHENIEIMSKAHRLRIFSKASKGLRERDERI
jgi:hypothetical protein